MRRDSVLRLRDATRCRILIRYVAGAQQPPLPQDHENSFQDDRARQAVSWAARQSLMSTRNKFVRRKGTLNPITSQNPRKELNAEPLLFDRNASRCGMSGIHHRVSM